ncbi:MAG TPA: hypothetical protein VLA72_06010 [Anaerolineales bacterium]|nr:hypothetical protein [Anaerolineales bacterium]
MNNSNFIRLSGWLIIVGAIAFLPGAIGMLSWEGESQTTTPLKQLAAFAVFWAPIFLAVGLLGLRAHFKIGGGVLLFGAAVGGLLVLVGTLVQFLTPDYSVSITYYYVWLGGVLVMNVCLSVFGVMALIQKPMSRWNWLPLAAGAWILLLPLLAGIVGSPSSPIIIAVLVSMTIAQVMLGYILQAKSSQEMATA